MIQIFLAVTWTIALVVLAAQYLGGDVAGLIAALAVGPVILLLARLSGKFQVVKVEDLAEASKGYTRQAMERGEQDKMKILAAMETDIAKGEETLAEGIRLNHPLVPVLRDALREMKAARDEYKRLMDEEK